MAIVHNRHVTVAAGADIDASRDTRRRAIAQGGAVAPQGVEAGRGEIMSC